MSTKEPYSDKPLSKAEEEVMGLLCDGLTYTEIAKMRFVSPGTVKTQLSLALAKLGASTRAHAARIYTEKKIKDEPLRAIPRAVLLGG